MAFSYLLVLIHPFSHYSDLPSFSALADPLSPFLNLHFNLFIVFKEFTVCFWLRVVNVCAWKGNGACIEVRGQPFGVGFLLLPSRS